MIKLLNLLVDTTPGLNYHLKHGLPLSENIYRYSSNAFIQLFAEARTLHRDGYLQLCEEDRILLETTDIGEYGEYEGKTFPLDLPFEEEFIEEAEYQGKDVKLGKPKRGGSKKYYVYTKNKEGKVIKVSFGAKEGGQNLAVKLDDPKRRKAFSDRHNCPAKTDKTTPGYWSCRLNRYAKQLGMKKNYSGYW